MSAFSKALYSPVRSVPWINFLGVVLVVKVCESGSLWIVDFVMIKNKNRDCLSLQDAELPAKWNVQKL